MTTVERLKELDSNWSVSYTPWGDKIICHVTVNTITRSAVADNQDIAFAKAASYFVVTNSDQTAPVEMLPPIVIKCQCPEPECKVNLVLFHAVESLIIYENDMDKQSITIPAWLTKAIVEAYQKEVNP